MEAGRPLRRPASWNILYIGRKALCFLDFAFSMETAPSNLYSALIFRRAPQAITGPEVLDVGMVRP